MNPDNSDRLSHTLADWRVNPPPNPNFRPAVWERIRQRTQDTWAGYIRTHIAGWTVAASLAVVTAGWAGYSLAQAKIDTSREQMVVTYLGKLDPRVMAKLRP